MSDRLKAVVLFASIAALWLLGTQAGLADELPDGVAVPEPASLSLLASGIAGALFAVWRGRK